MGGNEEMGLLEEDPLERWAKNQLGEIKFRAEQVITQSKIITPGDMVITGFELLKLLIESQSVKERYRFMKWLQSMSKENSGE